MRTASSCAVLVAVLLVPANAFYLPGVAPSTYHWEEEVPLTVNALTPTISEYDQQIHAIEPFDYYRPELHFCQPPEGPKQVRESLGSILFGDRIYTSPFRLRMGVNETCKAICEGVQWDAQSAIFANDRITQAYSVNLLIDGLPAADIVEDLSTGEEFASPGFPLGGFSENNEILLNNHWDIQVEYHRAGITGDNYRVVGVLVQPRSIRDSKYIGEDQGECPTEGPELALREQGGTKVQYTYSVYWTESSTAWATRWDKLLHVANPSIHWFYLVMSTVFAVLLLATVSTVLTRALRKDIARYNRLDSINLEDFSGGSPADDDLQEDSGWKLVHGDVFRSPRHNMLLSVLLGSGAQLFVMTGVTVALALLGFLSPSKRGILTTVSLLLYTILGCVGGYVSARCYKTNGGENWKLNIVLTPVVIPGVVFGAFFFFNFFLWFNASSGAAPFSTMLALVAIWFFISVPSSVAGSWLGFKQPVAEVPTRVNQIPRQIPPSPTSLRPLPSLLMTGFLPFLVIVIELYPILTSLWTSKLYYMFGFLFFSYGVMILTAACTTILLVYLMLCAEDYRWQWRAFIGAGMTGVYVFLIALWFWLSQITFGGFGGIVEMVLYLGYSALFSFLVFVLCGSVGFVASYWFVYRIYSSIKVD